MIVLLLFLILLSAFFSGSEIGMMSLNRYRLRTLVRKKVRGAIRVDRLLKRPDRLLSVILIGNTFANILASAVATVLAVRWFGDMGVAIATVVLTLIILIFAEIAPKTVAALYPQRVAWFVSLPLNLLLRVFSPFVWLANGSAGLLLRLFGIKIHHGREEHLSRDELHTVVREAGSLIATDYKKMLLSVLDLEKATVDDIMVARSDIVGIDLQDDWDTILEQLENSQHTRLPLFEGELDKVVGFVHLRSVLNLLADEKLTKEGLRHIAEECYYIPEGTPLNTQLMNFKKAKMRSGLVVDEYGDIVGLATLEDILEEIVGEFTTDRATISKDIYAQEDGSFLIDGSTMLRDINRQLSWTLPTNGPKTLNGLILETLEDIPPVHTGLKIGHYVIEVVQVKDNRIKTARVTLCQDEITYPTT